MATLDDFRAQLLATPDGAQGERATVLLEPGGAPSADPVLAAFGLDPALELVRVRVGDDVVGYLRRSDVVARFAPRRKDAFAWQRGGLLGDPRPSAYALRRFVCPVAGCSAGPVLTLRVDPSDPPRCELHPDAVLLDVR